MKILFLSGYYPPNTRGGGEISAHLTAMGLVDRGHEIQVVTQGQKREEDVVDEVSVSRLPVDLTGKPLFERWAAKKAAGVLAGEVDFEAFDVAHAHDFRSALVLSEIEASKRVATARDYAQISGSTNFVRSDGSLPESSMDDAWHSHRITEASLLRKPFRLWQYAYNVGYRKRAFGLLDGQVFISEAQRELILRHQELGDDRGQVIYNPVQPGYLTEPVATGVPAAVLYVGTVERYKGFDILLEAWREVAAKDKQAHLKIVGEGADRDRYERLVAQWGLQYRVEFVGRMPWNRLRHVYDQASVVVAPHLWIEPFGRTVAEAMARGRVVVAANAGGAAELIDEGSDRGFLFERGSARSLSEKLMKALSLSDEIRRDIGEEARDWVNKHLAVDKIAEQYEKFYTSLPPPRRGPAAAR